MLCTQATTAVPDAMCSSTVRAMLCSDSYDILACRGHHYCPRTGKALSRKLCLIDNPNLRDAIQLWERDSALNTSFRCVCVCVFVCVCLCVCLCVCVCWCPCLLNRHITAPCTPLYLTCAHAHTHTHVHSLVTFQQFTTADFSNWYTLHRACSHTHMTVHAYTHLLTHTDTTHTNAMHAHTGLSCSLKCSMWGVSFSACANSPFVSYTVALISLELDNIKQACFPQIHHTHTHTYTCVHTHTLTYTHILTHTCIHTRTQAHHAVSGEHETIRG